MTGDLCFTSKLIFHSPHVVLSISMYLQYLHSKFATQVLYMTILSKNCRDGLDDGFLLVILL
jgi:hypothetical protein